MGMATDYTYDIDAINSKLEEMSNVIGWLVNEARYGGTPEPKLYVSVTYVPLIPSDIDRMPTESRYVYDRSKSMSDYARMARSENGHVPAISHMVVRVIQDGLTANVQSFNR